MISEQDECMIFKNVLQTIGLHKEQVCKGQASSKSKEKILFMQNNSYI